MRKRPQPRNNPQGELEKEPFNVFFRRLMEERGVSAYQLARDIGVSRSTVSSWLNDNEWTSGKFRTACAKLRVAEKMGLEDFGHAHVPEYFKIKFKNAAKNTAHRQEEHLLSRFAAIDNALRTAREKMRYVSREVSTLFDEMGRGDLLIVFTASVVPLIYRTDHESGGIASSTLKALQRGALICVIVPTDKYTKRLRSYALTDWRQPPASIAPRQVSHVGRWSVPEKQNFGR